MNASGKAVGRTVIAIGAVLAALLLVAGGYALHWALAPSEAARPAARDEQAQMWTCSMHPQILETGPGKCPICGMDLVPVKQTGGQAPRRLVTSEAAKALMDIETSPVERKLVTAEIRMVGKVAYDETRLSYITAWVPGRIDRLFVDYTGITVNKGDHMVTLYSPELLSAQEELLQAVKAVGQMERSDLKIMRETAQSTVEAVRDKLRLWGLTKEQIGQIEQRGTASDLITIYAPTGGIVIHKNATQGMYVTTGTKIYAIADLSKVWVKMDAYESDLVWLRYGQNVSFTTEAYPGEEFKGRISFINPILDPKTRTVKVRVNVDNTDGRLKPDMFVRAVVRSNVAAGGKVMAPDLAGKWIGPMHPEIIKDAPGECDICGMPLVRAESLGYVAPDVGEQDKPLVIPVTAALVTGTRAVVYVAVPDADKPTYEGREIQLGPRAGNYYIVRQGLAEGELVVTRGNFKIDSALQIQAKPSMMSPEGGVAPAAHRHHEPRKNPDQPAGDHRHE